MPQMTIDQSGSKNLEDLLARIAERKDRAAFAELYSLTKGKLFSTVVHITGRWDIAEEIVQDAYVRIWLNASSYRSPAGSPMTWMITVARHLAIDLVRKPMREVDSDESVISAIPSDVPTAIEGIEALEDHRTKIEQQQRVFTALQVLDPARRDLLVAAYIHGESREQLSKRTGAPVNTVKTWIRRALLEVEATFRKAEKEAASRTAPGALPRNNLPFKTAAPCAIKRKLADSPRSLAHRVDNTPAGLIRVQVAATASHENPLPARLIFPADGEGKCAVQHSVSVSQ
jgi:RNA polymerase sigma-70 factor (ECF subfamily)